MTYSPPLAYWYLNKRRKKRLGFFDNPELLGSDLLAWWDWTRGTTDVGGAVSAWADVVNGWSVTQGTGTSQPVIGSNGIVFDGVDDFLSAESTFGLPVGFDPCEIWALAEIPSDAAFRHVFLYGNTTNEVALRKVRKNSSELWEAKVGDGLVAVALTGDVVGGIGRFFLRTAIGATEFDLSAVNSSILSGSPASSTPATATDRTVIGANQAINGTFMSGTIAHILVTNPLSDAQASSLATWLQGRL